MQIYIYTLLGQEYTAKKKQIMRILFLTKIEAKVPNSQCEILFVCLVIDKLLTLLNASRP
jgi:hypothetical protein